MPIQADLSLDEPTRLATLHALALLDSEPEREFDALVALAAQLLDCPTAMLTLVDRDRQWVKARQGPGFSETPRHVSFCDHTIRHDEPLVVDDASADPRFRHSPLVAAPQGTRFYAGVPIHALDAAGTAQPIGALCVVDRTPRSIDGAGLQALERLATLAEALIAARAAANTALVIAERSERQAAELERQKRTLTRAEQMAMIGSWRFTLGDDTLAWSDGVYRIHGLPIGEAVTVERALTFYPPHARAQVSAALAETIETAKPFDFEIEFVTARSVPRRVRTMGELECQNGVPVAVLGAFQDVTERHAMEAQLRRGADTDPLTGLANRAAFDRSLDRALARAELGHHPFALALIDLDGFKAINDTLGHLAGDDVLRAVSRCLHADWLDGSCAARLGGDEFALIVDDTDLLSDLEALRFRIENGLRVPVTASGVTMVAAGTVGIARSGGAGQTARELMHQVDTLLYKAKRTRVGERRRLERRPRSAA